MRLFRVGGGLQEVKKTFSFSYIKKAFDSVWRDAYGLWCRMREMGYKVSYGM